MGFRALFGLVLRCLFGWFVVVVLVFLFCWCWIRALRVWVLFAVMGTGCCCILFVVLGGFAEFVYAWRYVCF